MPQVREVFVHNYNVYYQIGTTEHGGTRYAAFREYGVNPDAMQYKFVILTVDHNITRLSARRQGEVLEAAMGVFQDFTPSAEVAGKFVEALRRGREHDPNPLYQQAENAAIQSLQTIRRGFREREERREGPLSEIKDLRIGVDAILNGLGIPSE